MAVAIAACCGRAQTLGAASIRALPQGQLPADTRLQPPKDLDGYFPFVPSTSKEQWQTRAEAVRRQLLVTLGLWPEPTRTPLKAVVRDRIDLGDYSVEKVYFESMPGFYVTGNLYRPTRAHGKVPGVLSPHGHWQDGRFYDNGAEGRKKDLQTGAETSEDGAHSPLQARCVHLARLGCVVFHYDMVGYADSVQIPQSLAHGFAKQRPEMNTESNWGLFSPQAESRFQSVMGLQTWDSIRALDFLLTLDDVDPARIGVTGASGGGTQTFILGAIDPRPAAAFPAVMVSTAMQGGCTCENASGLRVETGNVELAAMFAPKPLGMSCADDWTKEMPTKGYPELVEHFKMLQAPEHVMLHKGLQFGHNYNQPSRLAMYNWFNRHLNLGVKEPITEKPFLVLSKAMMTVWDDTHPKPESTPEFERQLLRWMTTDADTRLKEAEKTTGEFRRVYGGAADVIVGKDLAATPAPVWKMTSKTERGATVVMAGLLQNEKAGMELPALFLYPKTWNGSTVIWLDPSGKAGLLDAQGGPQAPIQALLAGGAAVAGVDLIYQGEFLPDGTTFTQTPRVKNPREAAAYTLGYNRSIFAQRVQDVLTMIRFVQTNERKSKAIALAGLRGAGPWAAVAGAQAREALSAIAVETQGFRFGKVQDVRSPDLLPGGAKYGDLPGFLALCAPKPLWVVGESSESLGLPQRIYALENSKPRLTSADGQADAAAAASWILAQLPK